MQEYISPNRDRVFPLACHSRHLPFDNLISCIPACVRSFHNFNEVRRIVNWTTRKHGVKARARPSLACALESRVVTKDIAASHHSV